MRVAALSDVHGNLPALEAVLAEVEREGVDLVVFGGDLAAGLLPRQTIEIAMAVPNARFVQGNADRELVESHDGTRESRSPLVDGWLVAQLERRHRDFLDSFELTVVADGVLYCHATPHDDEPIFMRVTPEGRMLELLGEVEQRTIVCGHTHMQFDRMVGDIRVVNAGSVGMPYGTTEACWAFVESGEVELRQTEYDLGAAASRLRASGHGQRDRLIAENILSSPSEAEAIKFFESQTDTD